MISSNTLASSIGDKVAVLHFGDKKGVVSTVLSIEGIPFDWVEMLLKNFDFKAI